MLKLFRLIRPYRGYVAIVLVLALAQSSLHYTYGQDIDDGFAAANAALSIDPLRAIGSGAASAAPADAVKPQSTVMAEVRIMR